MSLAGDYYFVMLVRLQPWELNLIIMRWKSFHKETRFEKEPFRRNYTSLKQIRLRNRILQQKEVIISFLESYGLTIYKYSISMSGSVYFRCVNDLDTTFTVRISDHYAYGGDDCILNIDRFHSTFYPNVLDKRWLVQRISEIISEQNDCK